jgi:GT2 family glycosyltransferase
LLLRAEALREVGSFDERYFMYWEDVDLCERLLRRGWQLLYQPALVVQHAGSASSGSGGGKTALFDYYNLRNWLWYQRLHLRGLGRVPALLNTAVVVCGRVAFLLLKEPGKASKLRAILRGARDGLFGKPNAT